MLSKPMTNAIRLLGDIWFREAIKPNTLEALEDRELVVRRWKLNEGYLIGLTRKGMDEYHKMRGWWEEKDADS